MEEGIIPDVTMRRSAVHIAPHPWLYPLIMVLAGFFTYQPYPVLAAEASSPGIQLGTHSLWLDTWVGMGRSTYIRDEDDKSPGIQISLGVMGLYKWKRIAFGVELEEGNAINSGQFSVSVTSSRYLGAVAGTLLDLLPRLKLELLSGFGQHRIKNPDGHEATLPYALSRIGIDAYIGKRMATVIGLSAIGRFDLATETVDRIQFGGHSIVIALRAGLAF